MHDNFITAVSNGALELHPQQRTSDSPKPLPDYPSEERHREEVPSGLQPCSPRQRKPSSPCDLRKCHLEKSPWIRSIKIVPPANFADEPDQLTSAQPYGTILYFRRHDLVDNAWQPPVPALRQEHRGPNSGMVYSSRLDR